MNTVNTSLDNTKVYMPQLDSLRAVAVLLVIIAHWFNNVKYINKYIGNGILGVTLFYVLSGYLITGILLKNKAAINNTASLKHAFKVFYLRRFLRIFPIYYILIFIALAFNYDNIKEGFTWHFFYLSNFYFWMKGQFEVSLHFAHLWSLSVEEQFYLFWPSIILLVPKSKLLIIFLIGIAIAVLFRLCMISPPNNMGRFLMPGSLDSFCIGALLAYGQQQQPGWYQWIAKHANLLIVVGVLSIMVYKLYEHTLFSPQRDYLFLGVYFIIISLLFALAVLRCSEGVQHNIFGTILNNSVLIYLGKISYGLYLFHNVLPNFNVGFENSFGQFTPYITQFIKFLMLVGIATISWFVVERPLLKLKDKFIFKPAPVFKAGTTI